MNFSLLKAPALVAAAAASLAGYSLVVGNLVNGSACPVYMLTGHPCPGCGVTRAFFALADGDVSLALSYNAFALIVVLTAGVLWARWTFRRARGKDVAIANFTPAFAWSFAAVTVVWTVLRLTPLYPGVPL